MIRWSIVHSERFARSIRRLDRAVQRRVLGALHGLEAMEEPMSRLKPLQHSRAGLYRLRVGDYRVIVAPRRSELVIVAVDVGHRSHIYDD